MPNPRLIVRGKVLRAVYRLLISLEETYPGLFELPRGAEEKRKLLLHKLLESEREHIVFLKTVVVCGSNFSSNCVLISTQAAATSLAGSLKTMEPCLECLNVNRTRLIQYHEGLCEAINAVVSESAPEYWGRIFALDVCVRRLPFTCH